MKYGIQQSRVSEQNSPFYPFGKAALVVILITVLPFSILACRFLAKDASFSLWIVYVSGIAMGLGAAIGAGFLGQAAHDLFRFILDGTFRLPQLCALLAILGVTVIIGLLSARFLPEWFWKSKEIQATLSVLIIIEASCRLRTQRRRSHN